ncbi:MAG: hypothetical protein SVG88_12295, partial [Halobacteriales archaeon]|nr:hypothetical protein [Halobacteriales archaeon]
MIQTAAVTGADIPLALDFPTSYDGDSDDDAPEETQHVFLRLETDSHTGYGEGSALQNFTGETTTTMRHIVREVFTPRIVGQSISDA